MLRKTKYKRGIGIVEIIIGTGIITISLVGVVVAFNLHFQAGIQNTKKIQATFLSEEGIEIMQFLRDSNWTIGIGTLATDTPYHFAYNGLVWELTTSDAFIDDVFDRTIEIHDVYRRDSDDDIIDVSSADPKTLDPDIKHVTSSVSWEVKKGSIISTSTESLEIYLVNIFN